MEAIPTDLLTVVAFAMLIAAALALGITGRPRRELPATHRNSASEITRGKHRHMR